MRISDWSSDVCSSDLGLHRRLALAIVGRAPASPRALLLAFMVATAMLSMIVSNTATTLIMMPVVVAILTAAGSPDGERNQLAIALTPAGASAPTLGGVGPLGGPGWTGAVEGKRGEE